MTIALILAALVTGADIVDENLDGKSVVVEGRAIGFTESGFAMKVASVPVTPKCAQSLSSIALRTSSREIVSPTIYQTSLIELTPELSCNILPGIKSKEP